MKELLMFQCFDVPAMKINLLWTEWRTKYAISKTFKAHSRTPAWRVFLMKHCKDWPDRNETQDKTSTRESDRHRYTSSFTFSMPIGYQSHTLTMLSRKRRYKFRHVRWPVYEQAIWVYRSKPSRLLHLYRNFGNENGRMGKIHLVRFWHQEDSMNQRWGLGQRSKWNHNWNQILSFSTSTYVIHVRCFLAGLANHRSDISKVHPTVTGAAWSTLQNKLLRLNNSVKGLSAVNIDVGFSSSKSFATDTDTFVVMEDLVSGMEIRSDLTIPRHVDSVVRADIQR